MTTKLPASEPSPSAYVEEEALIEHARVRVKKRMSAREWVGSWVTALGFMVAAGACALIAPWPRELDPWLAAALVAAYALASRVRFHVGANYTVPTQVVLVPMLFVLPTPLVPALVALAQLLSVLPDLRTGKVHPERALHAVGDSWYALAPALILTLADATPFAADLWFIYVVALAGQFALDLAVNVARDRFELGLPARPSLRNPALDLRRRRSAGAGRLAGRRGRDHRAMAVHAGGTPAHSARGLRPRAPAATRRRAGA